MTEIPAFVPEVEGGIDVRIGDDERCRRFIGTKMEGLYIKVENGGIVTDRLKFVRAEFLQCVFASNTHWQSRPILPNQLSDGVLR